MRLFRIQLLDLKRRDDCSGFSFRRCLLMAGDENSHMVGRLFFNMIQMKCFTLQPEDVCAERAWWGKCIRTRQEPTAYIRDATPYNY